MGFNIATGISMLTISGSTTLLCKTSRGDSELLWPLMCKRGDEEELPCECVKS